MLRSLLIGLCVSSSFISLHADGISDSMDKYSQQLHKLDRDFVSDTTINESKDSRKLFENVQSDLPASYGITHDFMSKFNPSHNTNDHKRLAQEIDAYCAYLAKQPVIQFALAKSNTTMNDFKKNWFGTGRGFEHVFPGELKGSKVSGYLEINCFENSPLLILTAS